MNKIDSLDPSFYQDTSRLKNLKGREGLEAAAGAFEAMFLQMVLKNMREASNAIADPDSFLNSQQQNFYREMADGQMASEIAKFGQLGLAEAMVRQMEKTADERFGTGLKNPAAPVANPERASAAFQQPLNLPRKSEE